MSSRNMSLLPRATLHSDSKQELFGQLCGVQKYNCSHFHLELAVFNFYLDSLEI
jgi:hypothetical protein